MSISKDDPSNNISVLLRVHFPHPSQPFDRLIKLPTITSVATLLNHLPHYLPTLPKSEFLDPDSLHIIWGTVSKRSDTPLNDENIRKEMTNVWMHEGGDILAVRVINRERSDGSGVGTEAWRPNDDRHQIEAKKRDDFKHQIHSLAAKAAQDYSTSMEGVQFADPSSDRGSSYYSARNEPQTRSHAGSGAFIDLSDSNVSSNMVGRGGRNPSTGDRDSGNNDTWGANNPDSTGRGGQQPGTDPERPGFWKRDGGWDSDAAARAGGSAPTSFDFSAEPPRGTGVRRTGLESRGSHGPPSPPVEPHVWSDDTLGDRPKNLEGGPPIKKIPSIFPRTPGEKDLTESRWATDHGRPRQGMQGQNRPGDNGNLVQGGNQNWGQLSQQPSQSQDPLPQQSNQDWGASFQQRSGPRPWPGSKEW